MGESFGLYRHGADDQLVGLISSANLACGFHAGDPVVIGNSVRLAAAHQVAIGAHIGFPDLMGFGRRYMHLSVAELKAYTTYQLGALAAFAKSVGTAVHHVKLHGALYMMALEDRK